MNIKIYHIKMSFYSLFVVICFCGLNLSNGQTVKLGSYKIDPSKITVSGVSSGAAIATQLHVTYSSIISGHGSIAGRKY